MKSKLVMLLAVLFVVGAAAQAADSVAVVLYNITRDVAIPPNGNIYLNDSDTVAQNYQMRISLENDALLGGLSFGFVFTSPDGLTWTFDDDPNGFPGVFPASYNKFVSGVAGSRWMSGVATDGSCWDLGGTNVAADLAPPQILIGGGAFNGGLAAGPMQYMLTVHFSIGGIAPDGPSKTLCIDSMFYPPAGDFIFIPGGIPGFSGRACYSVSYIPLDADDANAGVPYAFNLDQNRPNPFNPSTTVNYSLARKSQVNISIFNILGQKVVTLVNGEQEAGRHEAVWEGRDSNGHTVASGIYFYKMIAGDFVQTRKMALMR